MSHSLSIINTFILNQYYRKKMVKTRRRKNNRFKKTHKKKKQYGGQNTSKSLTNMKNIGHSPMNSKSQTTEFYDSSKIRFLPIDAIKSPLIDAPVKETKYYLDDSIGAIPPLDLPTLPSKPIQLPEALKKFKDVLPEELKPEKINKVIDAALINNNIKSQIPMTNKSAPFNNSLKKKIGGKKHLETKKKLFGGSSLPMEAYGFPLVLYKSYCIFESTRTAFLEFDLWFKHLDNDTKKIYRDRFNHLSIPVFDQSTIGSCMANVLSSGLAYYLKNNNKSLSGDDSSWMPSRSFIYAMTLNNDNRKCKASIDDVKQVIGDTSVYGGFKDYDKMFAVLEYNIPNESDFPYDTRHVCSYVESKNDSYNLVTSADNASEFFARTDNQKQFRITPASKEFEFIDIPFTIDAVIRELQNNHPVMIGITLYQSFRWLKENCQPGLKCNTLTVCCGDSGLPNRGEQTKEKLNYSLIHSTIPYPFPDDKELGGHEMLITGYDNDKQYFKIRNSWGTKHECGDLNPTFGITVEEQRLLGKAHYMTDRLNLDDAHGDRYLPYSFFDRGLKKIIGKDNIDSLFSIRKWGYRYGDLIFDRTGRLLSQSLKFPLNVDDVNCFRSKFYISTPNFPQPDYIEYDRKNGAYTNIPYTKSYIYFDETTSTWFFFLYSIRYNVTNPNENNDKIYGAEYFNHATYETHSHIGSIPTYLVEGSDDIKGSYLSISSINDGGMADSRGLFSPGSRIRARTLYTSIYLSPNMKEKPIKPIDKQVESQIEISKLSLEEVLKQINDLKAVGFNTKTGVGNTTWQSLMVRFKELQGFDYTDNYVSYVPAPINVSNPIIPEREIVFDFTGNKVYLVGTTPLPDYSFLRIRDPNIYYKTNNEGRFNPNNYYLKDNNNTEYPIYNITPNYITAFEGKIYPVAIRVISNAVEETEIVDFPDGSLMSDGGVKTNRCLSSENRSLCAISDGDTYGIDYGMAISLESDLSQGLPQSSTIVR